MELSQLRAILTLREVSSFAKAGQQLHLSPPAVFGQVRQLEDELGEKLYERIGKRLQMTAAGELLAERARTILKDHDEAVVALKELSGVRRGVLRLGCGPHGSITIAPHLLRAFLAAYPNTEVRLTTGDDQTLLREVRSGMLDVLLMTIPVDDPELENEPLWRYEMVFVFPPAKDRGALAQPTVDELKEMPFILYRRTVVIDQVIRQVCMNLGFEPKIVMENDQPDSIVELVKLGLGVSMLPSWSVADEIDAGHMRMLRPNKRQINAYGLITRKASYRPKALVAFAELARKWRSWWPMAKYVLPIK
jgi:DNA-binding transcriptional LysR family regulator